MSEHSVSRIKIKDLPNVSYKSYSRNKIVGKSLVLTFLIFLVTLINFKLTDNSFIIDIGLSIASIAVFFIVPGIMERDNIKEFLGRKYVTDNDKLLVADQISVEEYVDRIKLFSKTNISLNEQTIKYMADQTLDAMLYQKYSYAIKLMDILGLIRPDELYISLSENEFYDVVKLIMTNGIAIRNTYSDQILYRSSRTIVIVISEIESINFLKLHNVDKEIIMYNSNDIIDFRDRMKKCFNSTGDWYEE